MIDAIHRISDFLARRDISALSLEALGQPVDVLVLVGSSLLPPIPLVAEAMQNGCAECLLICGGIGHSTEDLRNAVRRHPIYSTVATEGRTEADILYDILVQHFGLDANTILVENRSTNCGANAQESRRVLDTNGITVDTMVIVQDPTMQRRTHASFERAWADVSPSPTLLSFAPFLPEVYATPDGYALRHANEGIWSFERFVSLLVGEITRLHDTPEGYGPKGRNFIDHIDIPTEVWNAYVQVSSNLGHSTR